MSRELVLQAIVASLQANEEKSELIIQTKGGWEIWMQCEVAYLLFKEGYQDVLREVPVYNNKKLAADLVFSADGTTNVVELKTLSLAQFANQSLFNGFLNKVKDDVSKINEIKPTRLKEHGYSHTDFLGYSMVVIPLLIRNESFRKKKLIEIAKYVEGYLPDHEMLFSLPGFLFYGQKLKKKKN